MKGLKTFVTILTLVLCTGVYAQVSLTAVPVGVAFTQELQDANASLVANISEPGCDGVFSMLSMDGRDEFIALAHGGSVVFDCKVNAPRAMNKDGSPKYRTVYQVGTDEPRSATYRGNGHWIITIPFTELSAGGFHLSIGLDGLVVGRSRPNLDLLLVRVPLRGHDVKEDRDIVGKICCLDYRGVCTQEAITAFLIKRSQEFPLTKRVSWSDILDGSAQPRNSGGGEQGASGTQGGSQGQAPELPAMPYSASSNRSNTTFVIENTTSHVGPARELEVTIEGPEIKTSVRKLLPGRYFTFHLDTLKDPESVTFTIRDPETKKVLGSEAYSRK